MAIGRKQASKEEDWKKATDNIESIISREHIDTLVNDTVKEIMQVTKGKKSAYSYSGGKESIALQVVCELAGIKDSVFVCCDLEYTSFMDWIYKYKPEGCEILNTHQDLLWLSNNLDMLFPQDSRTAAKWFKIIQHKGQEKYFRDKGLDIIILGRRKADGNYVGKGHNIYSSKGIVRYSPLSEWSHEEVLACIHYYDMPLPPIYGWKNGYVCGTHNFASRQWTGSVENGWKEVFEIEPDWVYKAAKYIQSAESFLKKIEEGKNGETEKRPD